MTTAEVERLVRDVIVHFGLPFTVVSVIGSPIRWNVQVRGDASSVDSAKSDDLDKAADD